MLRTLFAVLAQPSGVVNLDGHTVTGGAFEHGVRINTDGTVDENVDGSYSQIDAGTDWIIPNGSASALYEVRATLNSGSLDTSAGVDVWLAISEAREWATQSSANLTLEIRFSGGASIDSGVYVL